ncbi:hypothetical protein BG000_006492, partial [Podila horticola]
MPPKPTTAVKAAQLNIRSTRSSPITLTPPLTRNPKRKRARSPSRAPLPDPPQSSSNTRHVTRLVNAPSASAGSTSRGGPSRTIVSEEEEESEPSEDEGSEYEQEIDQSHSLDASTPVPNPPGSVSVLSIDEIHASLDEEDQFGIPDGESAFNTHNDAHDNSDHDSEIDVELPEVTEITLQFRRGDKPIEDPITKK